LSKAFPAPAKAQSLHISQAFLKRRKGSALSTRAREIIRQTYQNALDAGDKNVYFVDGEKLFGTDLRDCCTVDGCHPNDLGFYRMYKCVLPVLKEALK